MSGYNEFGYNEGGYNQGLDPFVVTPDLQTRWEERCLRALPREHVTADNREVIRALVNSLARSLAKTDRILTLLDTLFYPQTAPENFLRWILAEWFGWTLVPVGYPLGRMRQLLQNLSLHYERRNTVTGLRMLLEEFGVRCEISDMPVFIGDPVMTWGFAGPLTTWVKVLSVEPFEDGGESFIGGFIGDITPYGTTSIITGDFIAALCDWWRCGGTITEIELVVPAPHITVAGLDIFAPIQDESAITE